MTGTCLRAHGQIRAARAELRRRHLGYEPGFVARLLTSIGLPSNWRFGDWLKSWDVLQTARFLKESLPRDASVLDLGAYGSEILWSLSTLGFEDVQGIDLDPRVTSMQLPGRVKLEVGDFYHTPFDPERFSAVTAISVIEHGYREPELLAEVSRLLRPGDASSPLSTTGLKKIDTAGMDLFGMDWRFSSSEVESMLECARKFGLEPVGEVDLRIDQPIIHWGGKSYTFAWVALTKHG